MPWICLSRPNTGSGKFAGLASTDMAARHALHKKLGKNYMNFILFRGMQDLRLLIRLQDMNLTKSGQKPAKTTFFRGCAGLAVTGVAARPALIHRFRLDFKKIRLETMNATAVAARPALFGVLQRRISSILTLQ